MSKLFIVEGNQISILEQKTFDNEALLQDVLERFPEVIGQVLEYVAQLSQWRTQDVVQSANDYFKATNVLFGERTATLLDVMSTYENEGSESMSMDLNDKIDDNLKNGIIKLVIASDRIPETLRDTVAFINNFSNFDIYVLQIQSYQKDNLQIYSPTLFGVAYKTSGERKRKRNQWDEGSFFSSISGFTMEEIETIRKLYEFTQGNAESIRWGTGKSVSSFSYTISTIKKRINVFTVQKQGEYGLLLLNFRVMKEVISDEELHVFRNKLNNMPEVNLPSYIVEDGKYPSIPVRCITQPENFEIFIKEILRLQSIAHNFS